MSDNSGFFLEFHTNVLTLPAFITFFLTGLLDMLGSDDLDFAAIMGKVLEEAEPREAGKYEVPHQSRFLVQCPPTPPLS